jgi:F-type H+-transporting ATPase subunit b
MQAILGQLGDLFLASTPTLILFILLVICYQVLVHGPLSQALKERRARTTGAIEDADKAVAAAAQRAADYESKLRHARVDVFRLREQRLKQWAQERESAVEAARSAALKRVLETRLAIDAEADQARDVIAAYADQLADQVLQAVMPAAAGGSR